MTEKIQELLLLSMNFVMIIAIFWLIMKGLEIIIVGFLVILYIVIIFILLYRSLKLNKPCK